MKKTALNWPDTRRLMLLGFTVLIAGALLASAPARSQSQAPAAAVSLDPADLDELVGPIALYPDDILSIVLPASTFPLDVVRAARYLRELQDDPSLEPDESWDESIVALLNYPEILMMMDEDLDWTWALGEAVLTDRAAVLTAAQDFRRLAYAAGNLQSDDKLIVSDDEGVIEIAPANPEVIYIPVYEPREVIVYHRRPVFSYYPYGYPAYYYPYPSGYFFASDYFWGVSSYFSIGWHSHLFHVHHYSHRLHPYYLNSYYLNRPYYYRSNVILTTTVNSYNNVWLPSTRRGDRPRTITTEGRNSTVRSPRTATTVSQPNIGSINSGSTRRDEPAINGRIEQSAVGGDVARTRTAALTAAASAGNRAVTSSGSIRSTGRIAARPAEPSTTTRSNRAATPIRPTPSTGNPSTGNEIRSSDSNFGSVRRDTQATAPATRPSPRTGTVTPSRSNNSVTSSGATRSGVTRSAPNTAIRSAPAPVTRSAPAPRATSAPRASASTMRAAPAPRAAQPVRAAAPTQRSAPAPAQRSAPAPAARASAPQTRSSFSSQSSRAPR